ncbi:phage antirepressor KilAC domain-containing protein [Chromobacterium violaceum]|uniref:phage antirepressor KilAC domain-containing protein n=1 Tax=Chromobacterium violaceum TaxID=536 RepID=UPI001E3E2C37|nr:phage antirepressor KilAC domain-containing protein [Chromobacterium violaceum]MCD0493886.1 phage antirepressor KilAC domain-containing protein [Chromobacterium violaceum]
MELMTTNAGLPMTMSSREIALVVEQRHDNVKRTIETLGNKGVITLPQIEEVSNDGPGPKTISVYNLGKRDSLIVVAQLCPEFTARLVDRWQELEAATSKPRELTRLELLQIAMDSEQKRIQAEQKNALLEYKVAEQAPKVQFHDDVANTINCQTFDEVAKELGTGRIRLCRWLREQGYLMANNDPYQHYMDMGLFRMVPRTRRDKRSGELISYSKTLITGKGLTHIHKRIKGLPVDLPANDHNTELSA